MHGINAAFRDEPQSKDLRAALNLMQTASLSLSAIPFIRYCLLPSALEVFVFLSGIG